MAKKTRLIDTLQEEELQEVKEEQEKENSNTIKKAAVERIISRDGAKDKQISAKVNMKIYSAFTTINKLQVISNNSALNMLITKYVRENKEILEEDNGYSKTTCQYLYNLYRRWQKTELAEGYKQKLLISSK